MESGANRTALAVCQGGVGMHWRWFLLIPIPSREWIHIPPGEKENHLQNGIFWGDMLVPWRVHPRKFTFGTWKSPVWRGKIIWTITKPSFLVLQPRNFQGCIFDIPKNPSRCFTVFSFRNWDFRLHTWYVWKRSSGVLRPVSGICFHHSVTSQPERKFAWAKCLGKISGNWKGGKPSSSSQQTAVVAVYIEGFQSDSGHVRTGFTNIPSELSFRLPVLGIPLTTNKNHDSSNVSNCKSHKKQVKKIYVPNYDKPISIMVILMFIHWSTALATPPSLPFITIILLEEAL